MSTWIIQVQLQNLTWQLARCIVEACKAWQLSAYKSFSPLRSLFLGHNYQRKMFVWQNERPCSRENQALKLKDARCEMNKKKKLNVVKIEKNFWESNSDRVHIQWLTVTYAIQTNAHTDIRKCSFHSFFRDLLVDIGSRGKIEKTLRQLFLSDRS